MDNKKITPREAVIKALNHEDVYPIPVDVFENGVHPKLEEKLLKHFGLKPKDHVGLLKALNAHFRWGTPVYIGPPLDTASFDMPIAWPWLKITKNIWGVWEGVESYSDNIFPRPLANAQTVADIESHSWPDTNWFDYSHFTWFYDHWLSSYHIDDWSAANKDYMKIVGGWNPVFSRIMDLFGMEQGLVNLSLNPKIIEAAVNHIGSFLEEFYEKLAQSSEGKADILGFGDDFGCQTNMLISPEQWRKLFLPLWKRLFKIAKKHNMKVMMHMCGAIKPVLGDLIDAGLDIYEVVQINARGMDPVELKQKFGKHLTFYGGMDIQKLLLFGSVEDIRRQVRYLIDTLGKGGGYVLSTFHFLMDDVPPENALAMYDEALNYRPN